MHLHTAYSQSLGQKLTQHCNASILQLKKEKKKVKWNAVLLPCFSGSLVMLAVFPGRAFPQGLFSAPTPVLYLSPSFLNPGGSFHVLVKITAKSMEVALFFPGFSFYFTITA